MQKLERKIGYSISFSNIPGIWINGWMTFGMEKSWAKHGIKARGVNYFTVGALKNAISTRFLHTEKQYQSWLGAYLVQFKEDKEFTLQDHYNLAIADQKNWLEDFDDPDPFIKMPEENTAKAEDIEISGYKGKLYEFLGGISHSDVGDESDNLYNRIIMSLMAAMFNASNKELNLKGKNFLPEDPPDSYDEYETVILKGYVAIVDLEKNTKVVFYGNGAAILNKDGTETDYYPLLKKDIQIAFKNAEIKKI